MSDEPNNLVLQLLRQMRTEMATISVLEDFRSEMGDFRADLKAEVNSLRADVASDIAVMNHRIDTFEKNVGDQIAGLRRMVTQYHSSVVGHGHLISDLEMRVNRVERHLDLPAIDSH